MNKSVTRPFLSSQVQEGAIFASLLRGTMAYKKPEINTLGDAAGVIQNGIKGPFGTFDPDEFHLTEHPAYDLDE
jgi:hypothetical protein